MTILYIDRSEPFNPANIGEGWSVAKQDDRSLSLREIDLGKIRLTTSLKEGKNYIFAKTELKSVEGNKDVPLDALVFEALARDINLVSSEIYKGGLRVNPLPHIVFLGTILKDPLGHLVVPMFRYERWSDKKGWHVDRLELSRAWRSRYFSAVLTDSFLH